MIRLFVGLELPQELRLRLAALSTGVPGARWVRPENLHLSLRFIGEVEEPGMTDISDALAAVKGSPFALEITGLGHFESAGKVRVLWAGVERNERLFHLYGRIESALIRAGLEPEERKFFPHITLARLKAAPVRRVADFLRANGPFRAGPVPVTRFVLFSSFLSRSGAVYRAEEIYPLEED